MDDDEILDNLKIWKVKILTTLYNEDELEASELRKKAGYPEGSKSLHPNVLEGWGLIEVVDHVGANNERKFALTKQGREFTIEHILSGNVQSDDLKEQVKYLTEIVVRQERYLNQLETDLRSEFENSFEDLVDYVDDQTR